MKRTKFAYIYFSEPALYNMYISSQFIVPSLFIHKSRYSQCLGELEVRASWPTMLLLTILANENQKELKCDSLKIHGTILQKLPWQSDLRTNYAHPTENRTGLYITTAKRPQVQTFQFIQAALERKHLILLNIDQWVASLL